MMTEEGTEEIISTRSKIFQELGVNIDELSTGTLIKLVAKYPGLLRRPIMMDDKRLQVGYNEDEIRRFLPRSVRTLELQQAQLKELPWHNGSPRQFFLRTKCVRF